MIESVLKSSFVASKSRAVNSVWFYGKLRSLWAGVCGCRVVFVIGRPNPYVRSPQLDPKVNCKDLLLPGDDLERFLQPLPNHQPQNLKIDEIIRHTTLTNASNLIFQAHLP